MKYRFASIALAGALSLSLLSGCGGDPSSSNAPSPSLPGISESLTPSASPRPEPSPSATPGQEPSATLEPSAEPSTAPSTKPSSAPTAKPTAKPTQKPAPTPAPTAKPTPAPTVSAIQSVWDEIGKNDLPSLTDLNGDTLLAVYGISSSDLESYICKMPLVNVSATEFFLAEVKSGKMDTIKKAIESRQDDLETQWGQYLPDQLELVQNYKLVTNGNYILFAVSEYADSAVTAFNSYTK